MVKFSKMIGATAAIILALLGADNLKAEPKLDSAFAFRNRPEQEFKMRGARIGVYDDNLFFGGEQQVETSEGETNVRNLAAASVPIYFDGDNWLRAELLASEEENQSAMGARLRYFFDEKHSLGPIVETLRKNNVNTTHYGIQGHIEEESFRYEGGVYNTVTNDDIETIVNAAINFTYQEHRFGIGCKISEQSQWYGFVMLNQQGDIGYRLKLFWEPTSETTKQEIILSDKLRGDSSAYYPIAPREGGLTSADIVPEYPTAPVSNAGVDDWFLPVYYSDSWGFQMTHSENKLLKREEFKIDYVFYPFNFAEGNELIRNLFMGVEWRQTRARNETDASTTFGFGYDYKNFRMIFKQEEGSEGESYGYIMWSEVW